MDTTESEPSTSSHHCDNTAPVTGEITLLMLGSTSNSVVKNIVNFPNQL